MPEEKVVMYESPEAASIQTVTGWVGAGESGETLTGGKPSPRSPRLPRGFCDRLKPHHVKLTTKPMHAIDPKGEIGDFDVVQNQHFTL
jgi:hypothetical protein